MPPFQPARPRANHPAPTPEPPEVVDPSWILKALGAVIALGLVCAYVTLCAFFAWQQWQFVLSPVRPLRQTPAALHLPFEAVRFGADASGQPQLAGWWLPADSPTAPGVLLLHGGAGNRADGLELASALHEANLQVLLFDYRGFGDSGGQHPSQAAMEEDSKAALRYLAQVRHLAENKTLIVGTGLGASLAVRLCTRNAALPALVLVNADGDTASRVEADQRSRIVPVRWLFHERFPLADALHTLSTPKLLISQGQGNPPEFALRAADPKMTAELPGPLDSKQLVDVLHRFLSTYAPSLEP